MSNNTQLRIDKQILDTDRLICRHIDNLAISQRGEVSQDILANLRNFVEHIMLKVYANGGDIQDDWETIQNAVRHVKESPKWKDLTRFHGFLQISVSHYTYDEENSERLMLKYYMYLLKIRDLLHDSFSLDVLGNLDKFPLNTDATLQDYYDKIAEKVDTFPHQSEFTSDKYYIKKIKPFFVANKIYYEITFTPANDYAIKFDRVIAFTGLEVTDFYAVKFALSRSNIEILGKTMSILIITGWEVAIRNCEYYNFTTLIRGKKISTGYPEQQVISKFLTSTGLRMS